MRRALPLLALLMTAACGGGHPHATDATPIPDARPDAPGGCQLGEGAYPPDGGDLFVEYLTVDSDLQTMYGASTLARVIAVFVDDQTPQRSTLPTPGQCENLVAQMGWPTYSGTPRTQLDVGDLTIQGPTSSGTIATTSILELTNSTDVLGRVQDVYYQLVRPDAAALLEADAPYDVTLSGTATIPGTTLDQPVYVPAMFQVSSPDLEDNGPLVAGTDYAVHWTPTASAGVPPNDLVLGLVWLLDTSGAPLFLCLADRSSGSFTIPGQVIADYKQLAQSRGLPSDQVILRRDAAARGVTWLPNGEPTNCRSLDLLGATSFEQLMNVN